MLYPGDVHQFILGLNGTVTAAPTISIVDPASGTFHVRDVAMDPVMDTTNATAIPGAYRYAWNSAGRANGYYVAFVTYGLNSVAHNKEFLEKVMLGDSRVTGVVALDATVAKDASVAKDSTVAKAADVRNIDPNDIAFIKTKVANLPLSPADQASLVTLLARMGDVLDSCVGAWSINKTANPKTLTLYRANGQVLATYTYSDDATSSQRAVTTLNLS